MDFNKLIIKKERKNYLKNPEISKSNIGEIAWPEWNPNLELL